MKVELFLDEGEEYPQLFSVWRVDQDTGRADLTTRKNYVDDRSGWDQWRKTDDENIRLNAENAKLRELVRSIWEYIHTPIGLRDSLKERLAIYDDLANRMRKLGIEA